MISGYLLAIISNTGFNLMQYGHHGAQKSAAKSFFPDISESHSVSCVISDDIQRRTNYFTNKKYGRETRQN